MDYPLNDASWSMMLVLSATLVAGASGVPGLFLSRRPGLGQTVAAVLLGVASLLGLSGAVGQMLCERSETFRIAWTLPFDAAEFALDPLSSLFMIPIFLVGACAGIYAVRYWPAGRQRGSEARLSFSLGMLVGSMALVVMARNGALFLMAWEVMALSSFFAMTVSDRDPAVREAGLVYLVATHIGTLVLFVMFAHLKIASGSFVFPANGSLAAHGPYAALIFLTGLAGFGMKAGIMPLHIWLPAAHASAPSHVSAVMSGVMIKMGIYGILRMLSFFSVPPLWWGGVLVTAGIVSGVVGVMFALGQHDIKRLLAYHSIENIGIIVMGVGLALLGRTLGSPPLVLLGICGALLHTANHATFKSLLFLGAGSVIHSCGTREIDRMGGLARQLPWTAACFLTGAVAICGLPPLNGFISELLIYLGAFNGLTSSDTWVVAIPALVAPALALIGALAVACFVKVYGIAFLGFPRHPHSEPAHGGEGGWQMVAPMALLSFVCAFIGMLPFAISPLLESAAFSWLPILGVNGPRLANTAPLVWVAVVNGVLLFVLSALAVALFRRMRSLPRSETVTWDCGYLAPEPRMQYTASSFAEMLVRLNRLFLRTEWHPPRMKGVFPTLSRFSSHVPEAVLERCYLPILRKADLLIAPLRKLQHGQLHIYVLYIFVTLILLLILSHR